MNDEFLTINIKKFINEGESGESFLKEIFSSFSCKKNKDVENFLLKQSVEFTKKNQSVTYIVLDPECKQMVGYFTITIKPITIKAEKFSNTVKRKIARVSEQNEENGTYSLSAYLIAQLGKNFATETKIAGKQLLKLAIDKIKELQYIAGGMIMFLEAENNKKLLNFYENENGFKKFDTKDIHIGTAKQQTLVQLLKVL